MIYTMIRQKGAGPTEEFYRLLSRAYEHFNRLLFDGALPGCLLTVQRETNTMGYFSPERWGNRRGEKAHEIAINPAYFASHTLTEVLQTLVHEQCHLWQQVYGRRKSRTGYHNREWAAKMESVGLMPSRTGEPGGKKTGQQMSDYPLPGGAFLGACGSLVRSGFELGWIDLIPAARESCQPRAYTVFEAEAALAGTAEQILGTKIRDIVPDTTTVEVVVSDKRKKNKTRYRCPGCAANIWGKPGLAVCCEDCARSFRELP